MKLCTTASELRKAIKTVRPSRLAVAYLGDGWDEIIDSSRLKEIIVAPVLGSNPRAIEKAAQTLGFENVHFLDNLHAKIYMGEQSALLGSANLSQNGFSDTGNHEIGAHVTAPVSLSILRAAFRSMKRAACKAYPNTAAKRRRLTKLFWEWQRAVSEGFLLAKGKPAHSPKDMSQHVNWHLCWYSEYGIEYNEKAIRSSVPESRGENLDHFIADNMSFLESDEVKEGDWILSWKCNAKGLPLVRGGLDWMFVHHVVSNGADDRPYTKLAFQSSKKKCPPEPFSLTDDVKTRIKALISREQFQPLRPKEPLDKTRWSIRGAGRTLRKFKRALVE